MIVVVVQLGFHTCRGSASCGGLRFAFSFSFVTQASCGHRERGRTVRGLNGVGRGQGGRSHAQRACCDVANFCWNQSDLSRKRGVSDGSESGSDAEPSGWVCTFICTWWESILQVQVGTASRDSCGGWPGLARGGTGGGRQHEQHDSSLRSTRSAAARAFSTTMAAQKWGDKEEGVNKADAFLNPELCGGPH